MNFSKIDIIKEFTNKQYNITNGVYSVIFKDKQEIFIKNGDSIGVVSFYLDEFANNCVSIIRDDVKEEFLAALEEMRMK